MKFNCYFRGDDGSRQHMQIDAANRHEAFVKANDLGLRVIEMLTSYDSPKKTSSIVPVKVKKVKEEISAEELEMRDKLKTYNQREHSYAMGFLFGPIGLFIAIICWRLRGLKWGMYGSLMAIATYMLWILFGFAGLTIGVVTAIVVDLYYNPKPNQPNTYWNSL